MDILASPRSPWGLSDLASGLWRIMGWCLRTCLAPSAPPPVVSRDSGLLSSSLLSSLQILLFSKGLAATCGLTGNCSPPEVSHPNLRLSSPGSSCTSARALPPPGFSHLQVLWGQAGVQVLPSSTDCCVTVDTLLNLSEPLCPQQMSVPLPFLAFPELWAIFLSQISTEEDQFWALGWRGTWR